MVKTEITSRNENGEPTGVLIKLPKIEEMLKGKVTKFGTGGHVLVPKKYIGKYVKIWIYEEK